MCVKVGLIIFKNGNPQTATDPAYLFLQIKQMSPPPNPLPVVGFRTNRSISQSQNPMQNSSEFRACIRFFQGLSSIRPNSYASVNTSLDKKRRRRKPRRRFWPCRRGVGVCVVVAVRRGATVRLFPWCPCSAALPSRASSLPVCSVSQPYSGHGAIICNSLFGRERGRGREEAGVATRKVVGCFWFFFFLSPGMIYRLGRLFSL